jgi:hypothetical protein
MSIFQSASRQALAPHVHATEEQCPWCEQPVSRGKFAEITARIESREREQHAEMTRRLEEQFARQIAAAEASARDALARTRAEAAAAAEAKIAAARREAAQAAEAATLARLSDLQQKLAAAVEANAAMHTQMATFKESQDATLAQRVLVAQEAAQRERDAAILAEKTKAFEDQQRLQAKLQDLQRQLEKKSAHELGEGSEVDLFEQLKTAFEGDRIVRVGKGVNGADVIHEVVHNGKVCGKIVYDAKNRNAWQNEFVTKLRADKIAQAADHAILSSNKLPKDAAQVHYQDGVIVALPARVVAIVHMLRDQVVRMHELRVSKEGREQKSMALYAFITSEHCRQLIDQVEIQAGRMLDLDSKEQEAHRRLWDQRKKLINAVQKARGDLSFEIDRIIGTAGNGPEEEGEAAA